jgi:cytochrome c-type biogenesis protein CcmF
LKPGGFFAPISREGALVLNNLVLSTCCATVFIGTLYPLALQAVNGAKISVGPPFFNLTFVPLFLPLCAVMPIAQTLAWKRGDLLGSAQRLFFAFICGAALMLFLAAARGGPAISIVLAGLAVYLMIGAFTDVGTRIFGRAALVRGHVFRHALGVPRSTYGTALAHAGIGITLLGLAATGWGAQKILAMRPGDSASVGPYTIMLESIGPQTGPNYTATVAHMAIRSGGGQVADVDPAVRFYPTRQMSRSEAGIKTINFGQVYVGISEGTTPGSVDARLYWKPLVTFIWFGAIVMALGGFCSLSDRRLRIGVARRVRKLAAAPQAAE